LTPPQPPASSRASTINPAAGDHPITGDPIALAAAIEAGRRTLVRFPYVEARYGRSGVAFTSSDSGWLVLLADGPPARCDAQVDWLGGLLSSRGMPHLLLEFHLAALAGALTAALPARAEAWALLARTGERLAARRRAQLDDPPLATLERTFRDGLDEAGGRMVPAGLGELLGAAVADEGCGFERSVPSLRDWLVEPGRFGEAVARAADAALAEARRLAQAARRG